MTRFGLNVERTKPKESQPEELPLADRLIAELKDRLPADACCFAASRDAPGIDVTGPSITYSDGNKCGGGNWGSPAAGGALFVLCDGSVHTLSYSVDPSVLQLSMRMYSNSQ